MSGLEGAGRDFLPATVCKVPPPPSSPFSLRPLFRPPLYAGRSNCCANENRAKRSFSYAECSQQWIKSNRCRESQTSVSWKLAFTTATALLTCERFMWRCTVVTMLCVTEISQPKERRELGVPTLGLEQMAGVVQCSGAIGTLL